MPNRAFAAFTALATVASPALAAPHQPQLREVVKPITKPLETMLGDGQVPTVRIEAPKRDIPTLLPFAESQR